MWKCLQIATAIVVMTLSVCLEVRAAEDCPWKLEKLHTVTGFRVPESVLPAPGTDIVFVSNIEAEEDAYWDDDGKGFISVITPQGIVKSLRALDSSPEAVLHAPKGMGFTDGAEQWLYFTDNAALKRWKVNGGAVETVPLPGAKRLNDIATDGQAVYVSDIEQNTIYRVTPDGRHTRMKAPAGINGITFLGERMFCVSWFEHDVYELDPAGEKQPRAFGLAEHFTALDGIEALDDGSLIVSDFPGNKVALVAPDGKTVTTLAELESPADIGLDRERMQLYVPQFMKDAVVIFKLEKK